MPAPLTIRPAAPADVPALTALARATYTAAFGHSFRPADLAAHLARHLSTAAIARMVERGIVLVAEEGGALVGYVQFAPTGAERGTWDLSRLYVLDALQNQGIGSRLMAAAVAHPGMAGASSVTLDVWEHNPGARRFYERCGFVVTGTRRFEVDSDAETSLDLNMTRPGPTDSG